MFTFKHPKYYKELRKLRNKSDQAISNDTGIPTVKPRAPGSGPKLQASSTKRCKRQAASFKPQATSFKLQAASVKLSDP